MGLDSSPGISPVIRRICNAVIKRPIKGGNGEGLIIVISRPSSYLSLIEDPQPAHVFSVDADSGETTRSFNILISQSNANTDIKAAPPVLFGGGGWLPSAAASCGGGNLPLPIVEDLGANLLVILCNQCLQLTWALHLIVEILSFAFSSSSSATPLRRRWLPWGGSFPFWYWNVQQLLFVFTRATSRRCCQLPKLSSRGADCAGRTLLADGQEQEAPFFSESNTIIKSTWSSPAMSSSVTFFSYAPVAKWGIIISVVVASAWMLAGWMEEQAPV